MIASQSNCLADKFVRQDQKRNEMEHWFDRVQKYWTRKSAIIFNEDKNISVYVNESRLQLLGILNSSSVTFMDEVRLKAQNVTSFWITESVCLKWLQRNYTGKGVWFVNNSTQ